MAHFNPETRAFGGPGRNISTIPIESDIATYYKNVLKDKLINITKLVERYPKLQYDIQKKYIKILEALIWDIDDDPNILNILKKIEKVITCIFVL